MSDNNTKICIECNIGKPLIVFEKNKNRKDGRTNKCNKCIAKAKKKTKQEKIDGTYKKCRVPGFGMNDLTRHKKDKARTHWEAMLNRCYSGNYPTYAGCTVCDEWRLLSGFTQWFDENYIDGYELDKDLKVLGNKLYSPETCLFLSRQDNSIIKDRSLLRGLLPIGACKVNNRFRSTIGIMGESKHLGYFDTAEEASWTHLNAKYHHITDIAKKRTGEVKDALLRLAAKITTERDALK